MDDHEHVLEVWVLKAARTYKLNFYEHCIIGRRPRWNSALQLITPREFWIIFTLIFGDLSRRHLLEITIIVCLLLIITLGGARYIPWRTKGKSWSCLWSEKEIWIRTREGRSKYSVQTIMESTLAIIFYSLLTQRPITLVLMMINSCSYVTNDLMFIKFQI